jgi:hypothetical protein
MLAAALIAGWLACVPAAAGPERRAQQPSDGSIESDAAVDAVAQEELLAAAEQMLAGASWEGGGGGSSDSCQPSTPSRAAQCLDQI